MPDRSELLHEALKGLQSGLEDFDYERMFRPTLADEVLRRLRKSRRCLLVGPPRTGKTTLACLVGWEVTRGKFKELKNVRYLDLTNVKDASEDIQHIPRLNRGWLLIIDNWHARPDCHSEILKRIENEWQGVGVMFVMTQFAAEEDVAGTPPRPILPALDAKNKPIDTEATLLEVVRGMIDRFVESRLEPQPGHPENQDLMSRAATAGMHLDEEDYEQALTAPSEHKKVRGNLRFLSWRLRAWNPKECHLRDVTVAEVLQAVERHIVIRSREWTGTLEKVAALAQWEIPFRLGPGENAPAGIKELEGSNLVVAVEVWKAWRMDSTDAYLLILARSRGEGWVKRTLALLNDHLESQPERAHMVIRSVLSQASSDARTALITSLLEMPAVLEREATFLLQGLGTGQTGFYTVTKLVNCILRDLPAARDEADKRLGFVAALLPERAGQAIGAAAREVALEPARWLLAHLGKDKERFQEFAIAFLEGYGEEYLRSKLETTRSAAVQRDFLRLIGRFDPVLRQSVQAEIKLLPQPPESKSLAQTLFWLMQGSIESGSARSAKIEFLMEADEEYLLARLAKDTRAPKRIQYLLQSAHWLSPRESARLAFIVSRICPKLHLTPSEADDLWFLVFNSWSANAEAAQDLVDFLVSMPLHALVPPEKAVGLGRLLAVMEKVQPGVAQRWCRHREDYFSQLILSLAKEEELDELLTSLLVFTPQFIADVLEKCPLEAQERLLDGSPSHRRWPRCGLLALGDPPWRRVQWGDAPNARELSSYKPSDIVLTAYGIQHCLSAKASLDLIGQLASMPGASPSVPLLLGRHPLPWAAGDLVAILRTILRGGIDQRTSALQRLVLAVTMASSIEWPAGHEFDRNKVGHRSLKTAIHENMMRIERIEDSGVMRAVPNEEHPFVQTIGDHIDRILAPIRRSPLSLSEWDTQLNGAVSLTRIEVDYWRWNFLRSGIVAWSINTRAEPPEVRFSLVADPPSELAYALVDLPPRGI